MTFAMETVTKTADLKRRFARNTLNEVVTKKRGVKQAALSRLFPIWFLLVPAAFAISGTPSEITYVDAEGHERIYSFAQGNNYHLVVNYWNGSSWQWADQGLPAGASQVFYPSAITYLSGSQQRIYVFAQADNGHLVVNYWNGSSWQWADHGLPAGASQVQNPTAITYLSGGQQWIYVFAQASNGHLVVHYWNGSSWQWADQGLPAGASGVLPSSVITYLSGSQREIYVFGTADNGHVVVHYWNGSSWQWADQGLPEGASSVNYLSAITYLSGGHRLIYVFGTTTEGHLVANYWNGSSWQWADQGLPAGASAVDGASAITYLSGTQQLIYAFSTAYNGDPVVNYWNGSSWHWADLGLPANANYVANLSAITFLRGSQQQIYVFGAADNTSLVFDYWDGSSWQWEDHGTM
jgi:hypothetical protein